MRCFVKNLGKCWVNVWSYVILSLKNAEWICDFFSMGIPHEPLGVLAINLIKVCTYHISIFSGERSKAIWNQLKRGLCKANFDWKSSCSGFDIELGRKSISTNVNHHQPRWDTTYTTNRHWEFEPLAIPLGYFTTGANVAVSEVRYAQERLIRGLPLTDLPVFQLLLDVLALFQVASGWWSLQKLREAGCEAGEAGLEAPMRENFGFKVC